MKLILLTALMFFFSSCSRLNPKQKGIIAQRYPQAVPQKGQIFPSQALDSIRGSSHIPPQKQLEQKSYYLHGAEHLKLNNYYFDIPVVYNKAVKKWINYFLNRGRGFFERYGARAGRYASLIGEILAENGLPRDLIFLAMAESGFQNNAKSWAKAVGPWQFMSFTGRKFGLKINWYVDERRDPIKSTIAAGQYLKFLYKKFGAWELAMAAYNAGEGKIGRAIRRYRTENFWVMRKYRYIRSETKNYVPKIMALAIIGKNLKSFGFEGIQFHQPLDFEEIQVGANVDLTELATKLDVKLTELHRLNPEILRWHTPSVAGYQLRVPVGLAQTWKSCCQNLDFTARNFQTYTVRNRSTRLRDVAYRFKIRPKILAKLNKMNHLTRLRRGTKVQLPFRLGQNRREKMYSDLYEKPRRRVRRHRTYKRRIRLAMGRGKIIKNPTKFYTVRKGDTLWEVAKKTGTSLDTIIASNLRLVKGRMIRAGDRLVVR